MRLALLLTTCVALPAMADPVEITADRPFGALAGTLEQPIGPARAAALILPGSGPTDRDGNSHLGVSSDAYRLLARGLADQGIATARIDKRGLAASAGDSEDVSLAAYREDTAAWIDVIRAETGLPCVWLIGHSECAILASDAAGLEDVCGLVVLAGPGRDLGTLMREQISAQPGMAPVLPEFDRALAELIATGAPDVSDLPPALAAIFGPETRDYLRELVTTDPAALLAATDRPALLVHGDADLQVPPSEAEPLVAARPDATRMTLAGMTHVLKRAVSLQEAESREAYVAASMATYSDPDLPLHDGLIPAIVEFIGAER